MNFTNLHRRLLRDLLEVGSDFPLVISRSAATFRPRAGLAISGNWLLPHSGGCSSGRPSTGRADRLLAADEALDSRERLSGAMSLAGTSSG
jgi:hypothetical protein